jgi:hypothetical protein
MSDTIPEQAPVTPAPETTQTPAAPPDSGAHEQASATPAETPGQEQQPTPDPGTQEPDAEEKPSQSELSRKARNRERWQRMREASEEAARLRAELARYRHEPIDYSRVDDPDEALALRTAAKVKESLAGDVEARAHHAEAQAQRVLAENVDAMYADGRERMPDFDQVVTARTPVHQDAVPFIAESERGAEVLYHLGRNPQVALDLYQKFSSNPAQALIELGRIEARIATPAAKAVTKAPRPAPAITGGSSPPSFDASRASVADMAAELRAAGLIR